MKKLYWIIAGASTLAIAGTMTALQVNNIIDILPKNHSKHYGKRSLSAIKYLVIHHSAIDGFSPFDYARWHIKRGWPGIGYHYVIDTDGKVDKTNELDTISYHVKGHNTASVGISMSGNLSKHPPTKAQLDSLVKLIKELKTQLGTRLMVKGHRELSSTQCPGKFTNLNYIRNLT